jgi:TM2 domain-containing membrane protein YozV
MRFKLLFAGIGGFLLGFGVNPICHGDLTGLVWIIIGAIIFFFSLDWSAHSFPIPGEKN